MGILKTATGIVAAGIAHQAVRHVRTAEDSGDFLTSLMIAGVAGATAYHCLKDEVVETVQQVKTTDQKLLT